MRYLMLISEVAAGDWRDVSLPCKVNEPAAAASD